MLGLFPASFESAVLRLRCCDLPLNVDETGVAHRRLDRRSIRIIKTWRRYLDGGVSEIRIYDGGGVNGIPVHLLRNGENLVRFVVAMFARSDELRGGRANLHLANAVGEQGR
jgi:hypothetical protein